MGVRGGWHEQVVQSITATFADPTCPEGDQGECALDVIIDETGSDSGFVAMGVLGAVWNGPLGSFGVMALLGNEADMRLRLGAFFTVWF